MANKKTKKSPVTKKPIPKKAKQSLKKTRPKKKELPLDKNVQDLSHHIIDEVTGGLRKPHLLSFPYWSNGLILFSVLLLIRKAIILPYYGFIDVGGVRNTIKWYVGWLGNDILYCMLIRFIAHIAMRIKYIPLKSICVLVMCILLYIYGADLFALTNFHSRFILSGIGFFSWENAGPYFMHGIGAMILWCIGLYGSVWIVYLIAKYFRRLISFHLLRLGVICAICILIISFFVPQTSSYQQNILQLEFGNDTWEKTAQDKSYEAYYKTFPGKKTKPNIIVVFAESFSSIDSLYAGGSKNLLSGFDTIARDGMFYSNFIANGCTSDSSHIALLQGVEPWETLHSQQEYTRYKSYTLGLPAFLSRQGYHSTFVSTVGLNFLKQQDFLTSLQFDTIIGEDTFKNWKKYVFRAAPDEALYQEAEKRLLEQKTQPQFMVLQTISSHKPYWSPDGNTEEAAMGYADKELLKFYRSLQSMNYFDNGILIVVGDHRKMQAMGYNEIQRWGKAAYGKAVAAVVGKNIPTGKIIDTPMQHRDIFFSLKRLTSGGPVSLHEYYNDMFGSYVGRDVAIRYCQFVDRQYVASRADGSSWTLSPSQRNNYAAYIRSYYQFQQGSAYTSPLQDTFTGKDVSVTYPGLIRIAHQGVVSQSPPNSFDAFKQAKQVGVDGIEMDISFTKDGYPIVMHGPDIGRTKCTQKVGKKNIADFNLQDMKDTCTLYNGQVILTLQEMLEKTQGMFDWYFIDVKIHKPEQRQYITAMMKSIQQLGLNEKIMFSSIDAETNYNMGAMRGIIAGWEIEGADELDTALASNHSFILLPEFIANVDIITKIINAKKIPIVFTINKPSLLRQLYDRGVRYVLTDKPDEIVK